MSLSSIINKVTNNNNKSQELDNFLQHRIEEIESFTKTAKWFSSYIWSTPSHSLNPSRLNAFIESYRIVQRYGQECGYSYEELKSFLDNWRASPKQLDAFLELFVISDILCYLKTGSGLYDDITEAHIPFKEAFEQNAKEQADIQSEWIARTNAELAEQERIAREEWKHLQLEKLGIDDLVSKIEKITNNKKEGGDLRKNE